MKTDEYRAEFERETGFAPTEEFLRRVEAAQKAGMTDEALFGCLKYEAACARGQSPGGALGDRLAGGTRAEKNKPKTGANPTRAGTQKGQDDEDWRLPQALRHGARARGGLRRRLSADEKGLETGKSRALIGAASGYISNRSACEPVLVRDKIS